MPTRIAFFDRDGVLNVDHGYVFRPEDLEWIPGARESVRWLNAQDVRVVVVTNQSGIARGLYTESDFDAFMARMQDDLADVGARFDAVYHCPHLDENCDCRKPKPGMLLRGLTAFGADPGDCIFFGDKDSDAEASQAAGVPFVRYDGGDLFDQVRRAFQP